ncbi:uncharacterized protein PAC_04781 [Phialocephala subalpina]|uniref:Uncharacterized protein n=1 Tax=Phialocephala subalpina TaxID=576137 RepID=A0A1L7WQ68_9HELO|nr:uncharacterized protein PAC_04781 [Phialocephala subalpina]
MANITFVAFHDSRLQRMDEKYRAYQRALEHPPAQADDIGRYDKKGVNCLLAGYKLEPANKEKKDQADGGESSDDSSSADEEDGEWREDNDEEQETSNSSES